ncbi:queuosine 5'-phosphate N-glycosylase/hydrolase-like [Saccoglossus kowalevskii]|uniref:Queuosine 5'-phosphate N-glycosylase/hydrolase n=1 Tax=Saccoglossus kowalevskii TaxID=10224 RepID=A0ABM0MDP2_SACKO|nr:PREDICTED: UPF0553 protein C9orf64 homolog [Saccoglossus kowalevskii]
MSEILTPRESGKFIADNSIDVKIKRDGIEKTAAIIFESVKSGKFTGKNWKSHELHPKSMDNKAIDWIFFVDTLNFSFWTDSDENYFNVSYKDQVYTGYWSLCAAVNRALDEGIPITSPSFYKTITMEQLEKVLRSNTKCTMPLLEERLSNLHEAGKILVENFDGSFANCIAACQNSALKLLQLVTSTFRSYQDIATYEGKTVSLYKRAQIVIADIWSCFEGQGLGHFHDIDCLTMFADYRVPQSMVYFGIFEYSSHLMEKLKSNTLISSGERQEVEIRGCSIWAVELILEKLKLLAKKDPLQKDAILNAIIVDFYLWDYAQSHRQQMKDIPIHKTRTIYY